MPTKPYSEIEGVSRELLDEVREKSGLPDHVVEAADGTIVGIPEPESDQATAFLGAIGRRLETLQHHDGGNRGNGNNGGDADPLPAGEPLEP
jgi:hypothetical protein